MARTLRSVPTPRPLTRFAALVAVGTVVIGGVAVASVDRAATVSERAERISSPPGDVAVVFDIGDVDAAVVAAADAVARRIGATATPGRTGSLGMRRITRNGTFVHGPPPGWLVPVVYLALPQPSIGRVMGNDVAVAVGPRDVVMNEVTAELSGARVGDVIEMQAADGSPVPLVIADIRPYEQIGSAELVVTTEVADRLGATTDTRVVVHGIDDRAAFDAAVASVGLDTRRDTKVNRSWDPPDPDDTLSTARAKVALGEPWYRFGADGSVEMHPDWRAANLTEDRVLLHPSIPVRARCHVRVIDDLRAAMADVAAAGLSGAIDVANANSAGGCYVPRFSRVSGQIGFLSRHTYGMAFDTNTQTNCFGCVPVMHCDVVRIFRRHGFAWGGNFRRPDGMHFEWVGEPRDRIAFPSRYCPNLVTTAALTESVDATMGLEVLVAGDTTPHDHDDGAHVDPSD